ncbi:Ribosomal protein S9/S16 [Babesia microti strain RI]|uniref:Ribosomal protein S9/S16 n=1 Tax=Babesia microti (strain RI) TaxID=1133968 RepID=A0A0K3ARG9_BABMR|nr:Ribosomal protein S9/S16 [Babesia microti strain RI]CTQ41238.1 Ribosomal protein S9/S16 [Babesia microti strain RI]|eukprot:XP_012649249.1 Ribosomal protein S9/S16 [Babesia microti strain RI]
MDFRHRLKFSFHILILYTLCILIALLINDANSFKVYLTNFYRRPHLYNNELYQPSHNFKIGSTDTNGNDISSLFDDIKLEDILELPKETEITETIAQSEPAAESEVDKDKKSLSIYDEDTEANVWSLVLPKEFLYSASNESIWGDDSQITEYKPKPIRWSTRTTDEERMRLGDIYQHLSRKPLAQVYKPISSAHPNVEDIDRTFFLFDIEGHLRYYLEHLNGDYNPQIHKGHMRDTKTINYLLNREYIQEFKRPFPPPSNSINIAQNHLIQIIPTVLESLAVSIKNDPNIECIASPPFHDMQKMAPGIKSGEFYKNIISDDYKKLCDLTGVHEPSKGYIYPYANTEPLIDRLVMKLYLDLLETREFGKINFKKMYCLGKKKSAISGVYIEPGNGHLSINGRDGYQYLDYNEELLEVVFKPLTTLRIQKHFNVIATARGGGISGQANAIFHALSTYIYTTFLPISKPILRYFGLVTRDLRRVERKKPNMHKSRRAEQYSKR